jgi:HD superfamily phosphodiesterase
MEANAIEAKCIMFVMKLCQDANVAPDHGLEHALAVAKLALIGLEDFPELYSKQALLVILAALMHDIDDPKIFKTENYANAIAFLKTVRLRKKDRRLVIEMISLVSYSKNKNSIPDGLPRWALIPRDADRIAGGGQDGIDRTFEYNARLPPDQRRPTVIRADLQMFDTYPIDRTDVMAKFDAAETRQRSMFEFYITNWHARGVCASGSARLTAIFEREYGVLLDYWVDVINVMLAIK